MPIYEYTCRTCGHSLEKLQKVSEPDPMECPACGQPSLARKVSAPSFRLKGGGWYETDFKGDKDKKRNLADAAKPESSSDSQSSTKADVKADTKVTAKPEAKSAAKPESKSPAKAADVKTKPTAGGSAGST